jgi:hypothetical protein
VLTINSEDIKGEDYRLLIEVAADKCNRFAFVQRRDLMEDENVAMGHFYEFVENIKDSFIEMKEQSEWETTELLESTAYVFYYELNEKTKDFLLNKSNSLFGWISPYLPEDLMLYKDAEVWLAGCSHECWFTINEDFKKFDELIEYLRNA